MTDQIKEARDLLPCPFCGGHAYYNHTDAGAERKYYRVHCEKCDTRIGHPYIGKDAAREAWNTRAALDQVQNVGVDVEALRQDVYAEVSRYCVGSVSVVDAGLGAKIAFDHLAASGHLQTPVPPIYSDIHKLLNEAVLLMGEPAEDGLHIMRAEAKIGKAMSLLGLLTNAPIESFIDSLVRAEERDV
jgi:Lar family restriction alleviation protein